MSYDSLFDTNENRTLLAICTRRLIRNVGVGGIVWGLANVAIGLVALQHSLINVGILILAAMMLGTGVQALIRPSLGVILTETMVTLLLFLWNLGMAILNYLGGGGLNPLWVVYPLVVAAGFAGYYRKLRHLGPLVASVDPAEIKAMRQICKSLLKKKLKNEPAVIESNGHKCRAQLMDQTAFFIQRDLLRAFVGSKDDVRNAVSKPGAKRLALALRHPLGKLAYAFDKKNSAKLRDWLASTSPSNLDSGVEPEAEVEPS